MNPTATTPPPQRRRLWLDIPATAAELGLAASSIKGPDGISTVWMFRRDGRLVVERALPSSSAAEFLHGLKKQSNRP